MMEVASPLRDAPPRRPPSLLMQKTLPRDSREAFDTEEGQE